MKIILNHWGKKPFGCWWLNCSYNSLLIYYHPRYCFKYLKIRLKVILTLFFNAKSVSSYRQNKKKIHNNKETKQNKKKNNKGKNIKKNNPKEKPHRILLMHIIVYTLSALGSSMVVVRCIDACTLGLHFYNMQQNNCKIWIVN